MWNIAEEDNDDGDDEDISLEDSVNKFLALAEGVVLAIEDAFDGEEGGEPSRSRPPPTLTRTTTKAKIMELAPGHLHL